MFEIRKYVVDETNTTFKANGKISTEKTKSVNWILSLTEDSTESIVFNLIDNLVVVTWNSGVVDFLHTAEISDEFCGTSVNVTFNDRSGVNDTYLIDVSTATKVNEFIIKQLKWLYGNSIQSNDNAWALMLSSIGELINSLVPDFEKSLT